MYHYFKRKRNLTVLCSITCVFCFVTIVTYVNFCVRIKCFEADLPELIRKGVSTNDHKSINDDSELATIKCVEKYK